MDFSHYPRFTQLLNKNIMAIDFGTKVTGLALFKPGTDLQPYPFNRIISSDWNEIINQILSYIHEEEIDLIVLGIPYLTDGKSTEATEKVRKFGLELQKHLSITDFVFQDETLSTFEAQARMKNDPRYNFKIDMKKIDMVSACIILEDFIRS